MLVISISDCLLDQGCMILFDGAIILRILLFHYLRTVNSEGTDPAGECALRFYTWSGELC